ncbi:hypothetical protein VTN96DRAFT_7517 [Rasamsonia emersonii]
MIEADRALMSTDRDLAKQAAVSRILQRLQQGMLSPVPHSIRTVPSSSSTPPQSAAPDLSSSVSVRTRPIPIEARVSRCMLPNIRERQFGNMLLRSKCVFTY